MAVVFIPPTTTPPASTVPVTAPRPTDPVNSTPAVPVTEPSGSLPVVPVGESQVIENGNPVEVVLEKVDNRTWEVRSPSYELQIVIPANQNVSSTDGAIVLQRAGLVDVGGEGFQPGTLVDVWIFSTPTFLGTVKVGPDGTFEGSLPVPGALNAGRHTLQVNGTAKAGQLVTMNLGVQVEAPAPRLPKTGGDTSGLTLVALWLLVAGFFVAGARRTVRF